MRVWSSDLETMEREGLPAAARLASLASWPVRYALLAAGRRAIASAPSQPLTPVGMHLTTIVNTFLAGYAAALEAADTDALSAELNEHQRALRGFAYEGASMALALQDALLPFGANRFNRFVGGPAEPHLYMACVGAGWAAARLRLPPERARRRLDPLLGWLAIDGYGFHDALFNRERVVRRQMVPARMRGYAGRVFDQGLGRALWFVESANVTRIARTIDAFPEERRADLWSGVALAATYAGGCDEADLQLLRAQASTYPRELAQGAAFAAEARRRAQNVLPHTEHACAVLAGCGVAHASRIVRDLRVQVTEEPGTPAYEVWRQQIGAALCRTS